MYTQYQNLPDSSKVWVYQSSREFTIEEIEYISAKTINFIEGWQRHGTDLKASFTLKYNHFLVLAVDENFNGVSGCSIDASVRFIKELEQELNLKLTDRLNISFKNGEHINLVTLSEFQKYISEAKITEETIVFNNMVTTKADFETKWEVKAKDSWHNRFFGVKVV